MSPKRRIGKGPAHPFGGDWTTHKLEVLAGYLRSYTTALQGKPSIDSPFRKAFIDAFAGTGYRSASAEAGPVAGQEFLFPDLAADDSKQLLEGSARIALTVEPPFDKYIFIERSAERCGHLEELKTQFPTLSSCIEIRRGDANEEIRRICAKKNWANHRAVLFLDPYGMQVEWKTIVAVANTKAIDLWLLFPLGMGVNRLLTKSGKMPESWRQRLNLLLGTEDWYEEFYKVEISHTLFGTAEERVVKASMDSIGQYFVKRLSDVFSGVAAPGILKNSSNNPLYLLCFAVGNGRGKSIALRIAEHLLKDLR
jgi:three-Cys-motif partner protein